MKVQHFKIYKYQFIRAIACLLVVASHLFLPLKFAITTVNTTTLEIGGIGIGMFLFLSGYLCMEAIKKDGVVFFMYNRFFRIYPIFIILSLLVWGISSYTYNRNFVFTHAQSLHYFEIIYKQMFFSISMLNGQWTLPYEFMFYIILSVGFIFGKTNNKMIICMLLFCVLYYFAFNSIFYANKVVGFALFMLIGTLYNTKNSISYKMLCLGIIGIMFYNNFNLQNALISTPGIEFYKISMLLVESNSLLVGVFIALLISKIDMKYNRFFDFFANISYPLYLLHSTIGVYGFKGWGLFIIKNRVLDNLLFLIIITIPLSFIVHKLIEKPIIEKSKLLYKYLYEKNCNYSRKSGF